MVVTIAQFRKEILSLLAKAARGEVIEFKYQGNYFRLVADSAPDKLSRLTPWPPDAAADTDLQSARAQLLAEMEAA